MKGSLKTLRINNHSTKTNFNDWSDPKYTIPCKRETSIFDGKTSLPSEAELSDKDDVRSITSNTYVELGELRHRIRTGSPLMTKKEVREYRLPFHESLLLNLKDDGFLLTHEFVKDLIAVDEAYHKEPGRDKTEKRKILKYTKSALVPLANGLMKAESSRLNEEKTQEATAFLDLATYFGNSENSWSWIALEMFEQCMEVMKNIEQPDPQLQAISKHLYGSFLFYKQQDFNEARAQIESSMALSEGKYWKVGETETNLYLESCGLLHKIFLEMSQRELIRENIEEAIQLCRNSLLWAKVISDKSAEADALHKLIKIYLSAQLLNSVPELLECYMKLCTELGNVQGQCEGYILSARYNSYVDNKSNVIEDMKNLLKIATENHITKMVALAHHKLASYSLLAGSDQELLEHSIKAYMSYLNLNANMKERDEAKCLVGIAQVYAWMQFI
ncbi:uncharacterized protein LOC128997618 [Macrosteles quadrilineatus]|uniref:uncharacterized protein LOC128997618 n=1 Tax=Macrosteles quadrilineatus TaxID=74068 RepID=UPI0023E28193|nr:uncharacterized protein LOC128997618 [Macrosteles quadrilineatus]